MIVTVKLFDPATEETVSFRELPVMIGRAALADHRLADPAIPPLQCMIGKDNGNLAVWNLRTDSPLLVNGQKTTKAILSPGDTLTIGKRQIAVHYEILVPA
jgi:predicted component of type VI protein secretion system